MAAKKQQYGVSPADRRIFHQMRNKLNSVRGTGGLKVVHTDDGMVIHPPPRARAGGGDGGLLPFQITGDTRNGAIFQWTYTMTQVRFTGAFEYEVINSDNIVQGYNTIEVDNTASTSGTQSGINLADNDIGGVAAVPTNTIVFASPFEGAWWFCYPNAPVIDCGEGTALAQAFSSGFTAYFQETGGSLAAGGGGGFSAFGGGGPSGSTDPADIGTDQDGQGGSWEEPPP